MLKTVLMLAGIAVFAGLGTACFGLFSNGHDETPAVRSCEGLSGQALADCEREQAGRR